MNMYHASNSNDVMESSKEGDWTRLNKNQLIYSLNYWSMQLLVVKIIHPLLMMVITIVL
jgi:hypothetical protein